MNPSKRPLRLDAIVIAEVVKRLRAERAASVTVEKDGEPVYVFDANGKGHLLSTEFGEVVDEVVKEVDDEERVAFGQIKRDGSAFRPPTNDAAFEVDFADKWLTDMDGIYARERASRLALGFEEAARRFGDKYADEELDTLPLGTAEEERTRCASYMKLAARWIQKAGWIQKADELRQQTAEHDPDEE